MSTNNDEVKVDMPPENDENELDTSPQEHDDEITRDTATALEYGSSTQEKVMSLLDQTVRNTTTVSDNEISEEIVHTKIFLPHEDQAGTSKPAGSSEEEIVDDGTSLPQEDQIDEQRINDLEKYARGGKWKQANREIFKSHPKNSKYLTATISDNRDIALHVAVAENHPKFAEELVKYMTKEDLAITNDEGNTAFFLAAESGIHVNLAKKMYEKNAELPSICGKGGRFPIYIAAYHGHKEMTKFLYQVKVGESLEEKDIYELLKNKTLSEFFEDFKRLCRLAMRDDWDKAYRDFFKGDTEENKMYSIATISDRGDTALHVAVAANSSKFVRRLVKYMQKEDLAIKNRDGNTAFYLAALSGRVELAKLMFKKNDELPKIRGNRKKVLPIHAAAEQGHKQMVEFLYKVTEKHLEKRDVCPLLFSLIRMPDLFDVALNLLKKHPSVLDKQSYEALDVLAGTPMMSGDFANQNQEGFFKRDFKLYSVIDKLPHERLPPRTLELLKLLLDKLDSRKIYKFIEVAVRKENIELLSIIIFYDYPGLILKAGKKMSFRPLIHEAIRKRQAGILKLITKMNTLFEINNPYYTVDSKNNILFLAGELSPSYLDDIPGVALQMQYELWWFMEVRKIVNASDAQAINEHGKTPIALFNEKHRDLKEKGEKWMKDTANSCMIVAALIATVVFASAFTVPGGTKDESGTPHFLRKVSFTVFIISDAVSLVSSICSILTFLSILTSRYAEEDFLLALPKRLIVGLATLLLSIVAMMVVFCTTVFIVFKDGNIWVPILVTAISSLPAILYTKQQWKLLFDVALSTYKIKKCLSNDDDDDIKKDNRRWKERYQYYKNRMQKCLRTFYSHCLRR